MNTIYYTQIVAWKELQLIAKDRSWLVILFLLPLLIGGFMGGSNLAMQKAPTESNLLKLGLVNLDNGSFGTETAKAIQSITQFAINEYPGIVEANQSVRKGEIAAAIIIPADFSQLINAYMPSTIQVIVDPAEPESASIVTGILKQVVSEVTIWGEMQYGIRTVLGESGALASASPQEQAAFQAQSLGVIMTRINQMRTQPVIAISSEDIQGVTVKGGIEAFFAYLFPGLTVMFIFFIVPMSSKSLLDEREVGTLRRLMAATIPHTAIIVGKMLAFMLLACAQVLVIFGVAKFLFKTPLGESPFGLILLTIVVAFVATALGMMVAALAKTPNQANSIGMILAFVLAGLGGALAVTPTPLYRMGGFIGVVSSLTPHAHAVEGYYRLMAENAPLVQVLPQMGIVFYLVAVWRFKFIK